MIGIIDYGAGNLGSVKKALDYLNTKNKIVSTPEELNDCTKLILPGVGNFGDIMKSLEANNLIQPLKQAIKKKPFFGICLGYQVLFEISEESPGINGLGILKGKVVKFQQKRKVPQIGWNNIKFKKQSNLLQDIPDNAFVYFLHSYYPVPEEDIGITQTEYGETFVSAINNDHIYATQFHPEKSGTIGLKILRNFIEKC